MSRLLLAFWTRYRTLMAGDTPPYPLPGLGKYRGSNAAGRPSSSPTDPTPTRRADEGADEKSSRLGGAPGGPGPNCASSNSPPGHEISGRSGEITSRRRAGPTLPGVPSNGNRWLAQKR